MEISEDKQEEEILKIFDKLKDNVKVISSMLEELHKNDNKPIISRKQRRKELKRNVGK